MIRQALAVEIVAPIARRLGTFVGTLLTSYGLHVEAVQQVEAAIPLLIGVSVDVAFSHFSRKKLVRGQFK